MWRRWVVVSVICGRMMMGMRRRMWWLGCGEGGVVNGDTVGSVTVVEVGIVVVNVVDVVVIVVR